VEAKISGRSAHGIFDTGSDGTVLDTALSHDLGFSPEGNKSATSVSGKLEVGSIGNVEFGLGGTRLPSTETNVVPLSAQLEGLEFILGFDALSASPFTLWTEQRKIVFGTFASAKESEFCLADDIRPTAEMKISGERAHATLDTGSAQGVSLPRSWVEKNSRRLGWDDRTWQSRRILGNEFQSSKFTIREMTLCDVVLEDVPAEAVESQDGSFADQERLWGNVGNQVLFRFESLSIDGRKRVLALGRTL
jgi:predicted aspartyl protease